MYILYFLKAHTPFYEKDEEENKNETFIRTLQRTQNLNNNNNNNDDDNISKLNANKEKERKMHSCV